MHWALILLIVLALLTLGFIGWYVLRAYRLSHGTSLINARAYENVQSAERQGIVIDQARQARRRGELQARRRRELQARRRRELQVRRQLLRDEQALLREAEERGSVIMGGARPRKPVIPRKKHAARQSRQSVI